MRKIFINKLIMIYACIGIIFFVSGCQNNSLTSFNAEPVRKTEFLLGTQCEISIYDKVDESVFTEAFSRISEIEKEMTINNEGTSEVIEINNASGKHEVKVSQDTFNVLQKGLYYSELSGGKFDITIGPVVKLWNINTPQAAVPDENELKEAVKLVDYRKLHLDKDKLTALLDAEGMQIDVGGVAKGYAADEVEKVLKQNGVEHAIISLGGNILAMGSKPNGDAWNVGIQDPFSPRGDYMGIVKLKDQTAVTSGIYERFFEEDGKIYHHIMDAKTGYPVDNELASTTVITAKSSNADGMTGVLFQLGVDRGMELAEKLDGIEVIFITKDKKVYLSSGLQNNFQLTNGEFVLGNK